MVVTALRLPEPETVGASLDMQGVSHGFLLHGEVLPVLQDVSLRVAPGEFVALLGPSGCGKSTLLRLVAGLDAPRRGRIVVDEAEVNGPDPSRVVVFQDPTLFPWRTVWENAALGLQAQGRLRQSRGRVDAALALVGLTQFAKAYPHQLSGGMAQRAALARALVREPRLLLLDEPFASLDALTRIRMHDLVLNLWGAHAPAVLIVTHDVDEAISLADRVLVLDGGRIAAQERIDLPRPRDGSAGFQAIRRRLLGHLGVEVSAAPAPRAAPDNPLVSFPVRETAP
jgi:NitT/TauT family transport system ATP-binding protein